jgi:hypothetical protein
MLLPECGGEVEMVRTMMSERKVTVPRLQPIALQKRAIEILKVLLSASLLLVQYIVFQSRSRNRDKILFGFSFSNHFAFVVMMPHGSDGWHIKITTA